jgi:hypothetical protein
MKAQELRIGNLATVDNPESHPQLKGIMLEVTSIHESGNREGWTHGIGLKHINKIQNKYYETYSQFARFVKPIELTDEWLMKTDLQMHRKGNYEIGVHNGPFSGLIRVKYNSSVGKFEIFIGKISIRFIDHVHELQNWYHANTGLELTIKE